MKPSPFAYHRPADVAEAVSLLDAWEDDDPKIIAGGQSLVPMMNLRLARPGHLIDIRHIPGLRGITSYDDRWELGALTTHTDITTSRTLGRCLPLLPVVAGQIGYQQIRNRGTFGGSLCHADSVAEWPMVATLLEATMHVEGPRGRRRVPAADFFVSVFTSDLAGDELLTRVTFDRFDAWSWGFSEFARKAGEFAVVAVSAMVKVEDGHVAEARLAMAGAGSTPLRAPQAEAALCGLAVEDEAGLATAVEALADEVDPPGDTHASAGYRRRLLAVEAERALLQALGPDHAINR